MHDEIVVMIMTVALIFCTLGWIPILAIGKAISMIVEARGHYNEDNPLEDVKVEK